MLCQGAGEVIAGMTCEALGQIVSTFENNPQLPFEDAELHFFGGERAPLASPARCGAYTTNATFTPWSGGEAVHASSTFDITSGPERRRRARARSLPFSPSLTGGALNVNAGAFSPFDATFSRLSGEQNMQSIEVHLPAGPVGDPSRASNCAPNRRRTRAVWPEQPDRGNDGRRWVSAASRSRSRGGKFYLTGPYNGTGGCTVGASGLCAVRDHVRGPREGRPVRLREHEGQPPGVRLRARQGKIEINPLHRGDHDHVKPAGDTGRDPDEHRRDPAGNPARQRDHDPQRLPVQPDELQQDGSHGDDPLHRRRARTRSACRSRSRTVRVEVRTEIRGLDAGKTSKADGASLTAKLTYPQAPSGTEANIPKSKSNCPSSCPRG